MDIQPRPPEPAPLHKTTILLTRNQVLFLEELALLIRMKSGGVLTRGALIRALIEGLSLSKLGTPPARSERHFAEIISTALARGVRAR